MPDQYDSASGKREVDDATDFPDEHIKREIAERLRNALKLAGGPSKVSAQSGISLRTIANYTSGRSELKAGALVRLAEACNVSLDWLATGKGALPDVPGGHSAEDERLREIKSELDDEEVPITPERIKERPELANIRLELECMAHWSELSDSQRGFADLMLRLAFDDASAAQRARLRDERLQARLRASAATFNKAVEVVGREPPPAFGQALRTLIFKYGISIEDAVAALDALNYGVDLDRK